MFDTEKYPIIKLPKGRRLLLKGDIIKASDWCHCDYKDEYDLDKEVEYSHKVDKDKVGEPATEQDSKFISREFLIQ